MIFLLEVVVIDVDNWRHGRDFLLALLFLLHRYELYLIHANITGNLRVEIHAILLIQDILDV